MGLNPIRAGIASSVITSRHTGVAQRAKKLRANASLTKQKMHPLAGNISANFPRTSKAEYIDLVDWIGRQLHPGKRGKIARDEPPALRKLGLDATHWTMKVKGIGSGYWRVVGTVEELIDKAKTMRQSWLCEIGLGLVGLRTDLSQAFCEIKAWVAISNAAAFGQYIRNVSSAGARVFMDDLGEFLRADLLLFSSNSARCAKMPLLLFRHVGVPHSPENSGAHSLLRRW